MWEKIKQHPYIAGAAVGLLLLVLVFSSSSSTTASPTASQASNGTSGTGDQLAAYLASLNTQGQIAQLQAGVQTQQTAAAVEVAKIQAGTAENANTLAAQVAEYTTKLQSDVLMNRDTLSAQTQQATIAGSVANTKTMADALTHAQDVQAATTQAYISALPGIIGAQNAPALAQANKSCSSFLFGLFSSC